MCVLYNIIILKGRRNIVRHFRNLLLVAVAVLGVTLITGCGKNTLKDFAGTYEKEYEKYVGDPETSKNTEDEWTIILNEDGTGKSNRDDESYDAEWSLNGENFKFVEKFGPITNEYTGTLKDGKIDMFNGDPTSDITLEIVLNKK